MELEPTFDTIVLLFVLLNPFLLSVYLIDLIHDMDFTRFSHVLFRGSLIAFGVFLLFAAAGESIFAAVLHVRYASFLFFGGLVFLVVALRYVLQGENALRELRGGPVQIEGSIAMPFMIGPATVSASILAGSTQAIWGAAIAIFIALLLTLAGVLLFKRLHDFVKTRNEVFIERYTMIVGRISALIIGTYAVDMILKAIELTLTGDTGTAAHLSTR